jgi:hypothetical protein
MRRVLTTATILGLVALASSSGALARTSASSCASAPLAANVTYVVGSDPIPGGASGTGPVWANGSYTRTLLIYRYSATTFCTLWKDSGSFTTIAGRSPGGTGLIAAGVKGAMTRNSVSNVFTARWKGTAPTSGSLGTYPGQIDWLSLYFDNVQGIAVAYTAGLYQSPAGCWSYKTGGLSTGDVVTTKLSK